MAKKGNRIQVILECTEHKTSGVSGTSRYITTKNKKNTPDRLEIKKFINEKLLTIQHDVKMVKLPDSALAVFPTTELSTLPDNAQRLPDPPPTL